MDENVKHQSINQSTDQSINQLSFVPLCTDMSVFLLTPGHAVHLNSAPGLDASATAAYTLTVTCADNYGASQGTLTVNVVANGAPDFSNLPASTTVQESAAGGSSIFGVTVTDPDSDTFSCTMTSSPTSTAFSLVYTTSKSHTQTPTRILKDVITL